MGAKAYWTCSKYRDKAIQCKARYKQRLVITLVNV